MELKRENFPIDFSFKEEYILSKSTDVSPIQKFQDGILKGLKETKADPKELIPFMKNSDIKKLTDATAKWLVDVKGVDEETDEYAATMGSLIQYLPYSFEDVLDAVPDWVEDDKVYLLKTGGNSGCAANGCTGCSEGC